MVEKGWPWDGTSDDERKYGAQEIADAFKSFIKNGVLDEEGDFLLTPQTGDILRVGSGSAWINGHLLKFDGFEDVEIPYTAESETPQYGIFGLRLRPDAEHRDFTFFFTSPTDGQTPTLTADEIGIARLRYDRGSPGVAKEHIVREVERAYTTNPYFDKSGITMEFLNEVVSSYMELTPEGIALYDGPASDTGRKLIFGYDSEDKALKMEGDFSTKIYLDGEHAVQAEITKYAENTMGSEGLEYVGMKITDESDGRTFSVGKDVQGQNLKEDLIQSVGNRLRIENLGESNEDISPGWFVSHIGLRAINPDYDVDEGSYADIDLRADYHRGNKEQNYSTVGINATYFTFNGKDVWHAGNLPIADYVVEQGTSGSWTYRKWKSGTAECWGITAQDLSGSNPFGSYYIKMGGELSLPAGLFTGRPIPTVSCYGPDYCHVTVNNVTQSMISLYYITLQNSTRSTDAFMHLIGRWK